MKKKIFLLGAIIVLLLSFSISVSAKEIFNLTLDGAQNERNSKEWDEGYNTDYGYYEILDEKIHMYATMDADGNKVTKSMKIPFGTTIEGELLIFYDYMFPADDPECLTSVSMQYFLGSNRVTHSHSPKGAIPGEWYNVMIHIDQAANKASIRTKLASSDEWSAATIRDNTDLGGKNGGFGSNTGAAGFKAYIQPSGEKADTHKAEVFFDNIRVIQGLYLDEFRFMLDDSEITSVADITSAGTVKAAFNAANYDLDFNSADIVPDVTQFTPMVVAFDKDGMMLDCEIYDDVEIEIYDNPGLEFGLDITGIQEQLDGGTIRFYIWDSMDNMEAIFDEVVLPAK